MPTSLKGVKLGKGMQLSLVIFLMMLVMPLSLGTRQVILLCLLVFWLLAGSAWLIRRFGRIAAIGQLIVVGALAASSGYAYWQDGPNRELVAKIKECHASYIGTTREILVGDVEFVTFDWSARDEDIKRFSESDVPKLNRLMITDVRLTDETARRLTRFTHLKSLTIRGWPLNDETVFFLEDQMPNCRVEVR